MASPEESDKITAEQIRNAGDIKQEHLSDYHDAEDEGQILPIDSDSSRLTSYDDGPAMALISPAGGFNAAKNRAPRSKPIPKKMAALIRKAELDA